MAPMMAAGFGTSFALTGSTASVMGAAPPEYSGAASGLFNTARQIGSATGVALSGSLLATATGAGSGLRAAGCGLRAAGCGLRTSMAIGALAYLIAAGLAWLCVPAKPERTKGS
ncbi:hypothetical protein [Streptomyces bathyalis]|uniref:hypothetical protein n=1 Tax=Streptomyces bathyalis TaxID=2710756 RepID=UPI001FE999A8|nr:hypothetical protein [Streptomyces bathyalis]